MTDMGKINSSWYASSSDEWATPQDFYDRLNDRYHFTLDPCASETNAKCTKYYTKVQDGLIKDWSGEVCWVNPPYGSETKKWVKKCFFESLKGTQIALLIPARTDTSYFHDFILGKARLEFVRGRLHFNDGEQGAPFPSVVAFYNL